MVRRLYRLQGKKDQPSSAENVYRQKENAAVAARECLDVVMVKISIKRAVMIIILSKKSMHVYIFATNVKSIVQIKTNM